MNLRNILFVELINIEKEQKKLSKRRLELRRMLNLGEDKKPNKFTNKKYSKQNEPYY